MLQERSFAGWTDARHLVQGGSMQRLLAPGAVGADGKPMRLVTQFLDAIQHGIAGFQKHRLTPSQIDALPPSVAVRSLGDSGELDLGQA